MKFNDLPPSAFPKLQQLGIYSTFLHDTPFNEYLDLVNFIQNVNFSRISTISAITRITKSTEYDVNKLFEILVQDFETYGLDFHGVVYGLYLLGAYKEASKITEDRFKEKCPTFYDRIEELKSRLYVQQAEKALNDILRDFTSTAQFELSFSTRIKNPGSLFAKLVSQDKYKPSHISNLSPKELRSQDMPYDLVGGKVVFFSKDGITFTEQTGELIAYFRALGIELRDQLVFSPGWMNRKSLISYIDAEGNSQTPFQLHVWDIHASKYELMSYGNYKMNKIFYPVIENWRPLLDREISLEEFAELTISVFRKLT